MNIRSATVRDLDDLVRMMRHVYAAQHYDLMGPCVDSDNRTTVAHQLDDDETLVMVVEATGAVGIGA